MKAIHPLEMPAASDSPEDPRAQSRFFIAILTIAAAIVLVGFAPTFFLRRFTSAAPLAPLYVVHGLLFTAWIALAIVQSLLIRNGRARIHRRLGVVGVVLTPALVALGVRVSIQSLPTSEWPSRFGVPPLVFVIVPLGQITIFGILVTIAFLLRRHAEAHKRLMLLATINLTAPAVARVTYNLFHIASPLFIAGTMAALVAACIAFEWNTYRRVHPVFAVAAPLTVLSFPLRIAFAHTDVWLSFASWIAGAA